MTGEDRVRASGRKIASVVGAARLKDDRMALARPRDVQRPGDGEELSSMMEGVLLAPVEEHSSRLVPREGVILVRVPCSPRTTSRCSFARR